MNLLPDGGTAVEDKYTKTQFLRDQAFAGNLCLLLGFLLGAICTTGIAMMLAADNESDGLFGAGMTVSLLSLIAIACLYLLIILRPYKRKKDRTDAARSAEP